MKKSIPFIKHQSQDLSLPPVYVTYITSKKTWTLVDNYRITLPIDDYNEIKFEIPMGFDFDLASIPRLIWPLISSFELSLVAPLIHDYCYQYQGSPVYHIKLVRGIEEKTYNYISRAEADKIFFDLMIREKVPRWKANSSYTAVRLFATRW